MKILNNEFCKLTYNENARTKSCIFHFHDIVFQVFHLVIDNFSHKLFPDYLHLKDNYHLLKPKNNDGYYQDK